MYIIHHISFESPHTSFIQTRSRPTHPISSSSKNDKNTTRPTAEGVNPNSRSVFPNSARVKVFLENKFGFSDPTSHTRCTHLGNCWVNETVSTVTLNVCAATNSATSHSAVEQTGSVRESGPPKRGRRKTREMNGKGNEANHVLESLGSVVTYGVPPLASLI